MTPEKRLDQIEPVIADTAQKVDRLVETTGRIAVEVSKIPAQERSIALTAKGLADLTQITARRFDNVDQRFDGIDQRLDAMDQRFDGIDQRFEGVNQQLDQLQQDTGDLKQGQSSLEQGQQQIIQQLSQLQQVIIQMMGNRPS
ncbi:hypothetical protein [Spirosoma rhododendri]|uniref:hypothetical protein n=1 Tax=Spirosoma rhododendri TaxID=2728024 RepID=UPI00158417BD|nr:hypothetical protein [Spirosoma rhododendri]